MAHYKDLNKELVEQVQAMRIRLHEHQVEIIHLRHKWMCEHEDLVKMREKCNAMALMHCRQYLEFLDPESPLLPSLPNEDQIMSQKTSSVKGEGNGISKRRQSVRLSDECRRSSSLTQTRKSFNATSPIRSPSCNSKEVREDDDDDDDDDDDVVETEVATMTGIVSKAILEEDEEKMEEHEQELTENETNNNTKDDTSQSKESSKTSRTLCQSTTSTDEESTSSATPGEATSEVNTLAHRTRSFRDITNIVGNTKNSSKKKMSNSAGDSKNSVRFKNSVSKRNKASNSLSLDTENENPKPLSSPRQTLKKFHSNKRIKHVTVRRGNKDVEKQSVTNTNRSALKVPKQLNDSDMELESNSDDSPYEEKEKDVDEESIQEARYMVKEIQYTGESFHTPDIEETAGSCALSEISFSQFDKATSSTPRQPVRNSMPSDSSPDRSSRPKRSCIPKSFVEPRMNTKLRNESNEKSLTNKLSRFKLDKRIK